jgi:hypothetical protein
VKAETAGLILFGLAEPVQVMSGFLPSPATGEATAQTQGGRRRARLRRNMVQGAAISIGINIAIALMTYQELGNDVFWLPVAGGAIIAFFCWEFVSAQRAGAQQGEAQQGLGI